MKLVITFLTIIFLFTACSYENKEPQSMPILTDIGVNSLDAKTPYKLSSIAPKLLGYDINIFTSWEHGEAINVMRVSYNSKEAMIIIPTKLQNNSQQFIKNISITSDYIENPFDIKIGTKYNRDDFSTCQEKDETIVCKKEKFNNIELIFKKDYKQIWSLKEIFWNSNA